MIFSMWICSWRTECSMTRRALILFTDIATRQLSWPFAGVSTLCIVQIVYWSAQCFVASSFINVWIHDKRNHTRSLNHYPVLHCYRQQPITTAGTVFKTSHIVLHNGDSQVDSLNDHYYGIRSVCWNHYGYCQISVLLPVSKIHYVVVFPWLMFLNDVYLVLLELTAVPLILTCPTSCWQQENELWDTA